MDVEKFGCCFSCIFHHFSRDGRHVFPLQLLARYWGGTRNYGIEHEVWQ